MRRMKKYTYTFIFFMFCKALAIADLSDSTTLPTSIPAIFSTWQEQFNCAASQSLLGLDLCLGAYVNFISNNPSITNLQQWYTTSSDEDKLKAQIAYQTFYISLIDHIKNREKSKDLSPVWESLITHINLSHNQIETLFLSSQGTSIPFIAGISSAMISCIYVLHIGYKKVKYNRKRES